MKDYGIPIPLVYEYLVGLKEWHLQSQGGEWYEYCMYAFANVGYLMRTILDDT